MIELAPDTACMLYVGSLLLLLFLSWLRASQRAKKREIVRLSSTRATCEYCGASYLIESFTPFHRCPTCQCINTKKD